MQSDTSDEEIVMVMLCLDSSGLLINKHMKIEVRILKFQSVDVLHIHTLWEKAAVEN